jgi:hypothetical protein
VVDGVLAERARRVAEVRLAPMATRLAHVRRVAAAAERLVEQFDPLEAECEDCETPRRRILLRWIDRPQEHVSVVPSAIVLDDPPQAPKRRRMPPQNSRDIPAVLGPFFGASSVVADRRGYGQQVATRLVDDRLSRLQAQSFDEGVGGQAVFGQLIRA